MGSTNTGTAHPLDVLEAALRGGVTCFQLREKGPGSLIGIEKQNFAEACQKLCRQYNVPFIVNDDVDLAIAISADGVHIGQEDEDPKSVRERIGIGKILGVSTHTESEVQEALSVGADYVGIGPVYATLSKADAKPVAGTKFIREMAKAFPDLPIVGIGGITSTSFKPVFEAGAVGISLISAITLAEDPFAISRYFIESIDAILNKVGTSSFER